MEQNKLEIPIKQIVIPLKLFVLLTFFAITLYLMKSCIDAKTIHQATEATKVTREAYGIYTNVKFGWTIYNKVLEFSKKKDETKEETKQVEQTEQTEKQTDEWQDKKRSGKNEPHKNQKAQDALQKQYEQLKKELDQLRAKTNKTKEEAKQFLDLKKKVNRLFDKVKEKGGTHSKKGKGFH